MSMIEKVARAIAQEQGRSDWLQCVATARAAVVALSVPSVDMLYAALPDCPDWGYLPEDWSAMIAYVAHEKMGTEV
jgi:hypothetical protein